MNTLLQFTDFRKRYGPKTVLARQSFDMTGGIHLLTGPNGSGKSTLLKILAGMIPFEGQIELLGQITLQQDHRAHRLAVSYAEAEPLFPPYLTGQYLVDLFITLKEGQLAQLATLKEILGITDYFDQKIATYSSGMKKKLALCLSMVGNPRLILLDEPFNTLDPDSRLHLEQYLAQLAAQGIHLLLATHQSEGLHFLEPDHRWAIHQHMIQPL